MKDPEETEVLVPVVSLSVPIACLSLQLSLCVALCVHVCVVCVCECVWQRHPLGNSGKLCGGSLGRPRDIVDFTVA